MQKRILCALVAWAAAGSMTAQQVVVDVILEEDQSLRQRVAQALPLHVGAAVLVRVEGETVFKEVYGSRKLGEPPIVTTSTAFRLAAATKPFTAAAVLSLVDSEKLQLEEELGAIFEGLPDKIGMIKIEQLLTHCSGLPQYYRRMNEANAPAQPDGERYFTDTDVLEWLRGEEAVLFEPGESTQYNDTNYVVLALVVEEVSGVPFEDYLRTALFEPAGMTDACVLVSGKSEPDERAYGHNRVRGNEGFPNAAVQKLTRDQRIKALGPEKVSALVKQVVMKASGYDVEDQSTYSRLRGDGCLYASIDDLEAWFAALSNGQVLSDESRRLMTTGLVEPDPRRVLQFVSTREFTCGWLRDEFADEARLTNPGATRGFCQTVQWMPESDSAVVVLMNTDGPWEITRLGENVLTMVVSDLSQNADSTEGSAEHADSEAKTE